LMSSCQDIWTSLRVLLILMTFLWMFRENNYSKWKWLKLWVKNLLRKLLKWSKLLLMNRMKKMRKKKEKKKEKKEKKKKRKM
jgi:hypothetical protein